MCVTTWLKSNSGHTSTSRIYQIKSINQFFCVSFSVEQTNFKLKSNLCLSTCQQQQKKNRNRSFFFLLENPKFFSIDSLLITLITTIITVVSYLHKSLIFVKKIIIIIDVRKTNKQHNKMYPSDLIRQTITKYQNQIDRIEEKYSNIYQTKPTKQFWLDEWSNLVFWENGIGKIETFLFCFDQYQFDCSRI